MGALAVAATVLLVATCDGGPDGADPADAGLDASVDAGTPPVEHRDAESPWHDAGPGDAGLDAGPPPVYRDAGLAEVRWERYPGLPDECIIERAVDPSEVYISQWEPCPGAEDHCERLVVDWAFQIWRPYSARSGNSHTGEYGYWRMRLEYPGTGSLPPPDVMVLPTTRGSPLIAYKYERCAMGTAMSEDTIAHMIFDFRAAEPRGFIYFGSPEQASALDMPSAVINVEETGVTGLQEPVVTPDQLVGVVQPGNFLYAIRRTGETRRIDAHRPTSGIQTPRLVGDHLLWKEYGARWSVVHEAEDGTIEPFIEPHDADVREFKSDGARMVWVQSYPPGGGARYVRHEIWTAPYVRSPADLDGARRVLTIEDQRHPLAGGRLRGDRYVFTRRTVDGSFTLELVDLATGERRRFSLPPYREEMDPWVVYMSDSEAMVHTGAAGTRGIPMRIALERMPIIDP